MQLIIDRIGKIEHAALDINGLTVIAGKNDTGKSTVGKVLYALIKSLNRYDSFFEKTQLSKIKQNLILPLLQKVTMSGEIKDELLVQVATLLDDLRSSGHEETPRPKHFSREDISKLLNEIKTEITSADLLQKIEDVFHAFTEMDNQSEKEKYRETFLFDLQGIFCEEINNSKHHEPGNIQLLNQEGPFLAVSIEQNQIAALTCNFLKARSVFGKVLYIETPFVFEDILAVHKPNWLEVWLALKGKDAEKQSAVDLLGDVSVNTELLQFIQNNIFHKARFGFDKERRSWCYQVDEEATRLLLPNVACGIKAFGLLFALLQKNLLTKDTLLVLDEPENHLHPEFQIEYAQMIALLVKEGFSVVLTSHSPTLIQALFAYSHKYQIEKQTSYYLAQQVNGQNYSRFTDVTNQVEKITENLVSPMDKLFLGV